MGASMTHSPIGLHGLLPDSFTFYFTHIFQFMNSGKNGIHFTGTVIGENNGNTADTVHICLLTLCGPVANILAFGF
jgi:hypothetical protein